MNNQPDTVTIEVSNIPAELQQHRQFVLWKNERDTKVPYSVAGSTASSTDETTWATFGEVVACYSANKHKYAGVGIVLTAGDLFCGVDLDGCRTDTGNITPEAQVIVSQLNSYTEVSPSGRGVKVYLRAAKPGERCSNDKVAGFKKIEVYDHARYFTLTGRHLAGTPTTVEDRQDELTAIYRRYVCPPPPPRGKTSRQRCGGTDSSSAIEQCKHYVFKCPGAISGSGGHNATLRVACECFRFGLSDAEAREVLEQFNDTKCEPCWSTRELEHKLADAKDKVDNAGEFGCKVKDEPGGGVHAPTSTVDSGSFNLTDYGNAQRLVTLHGDDLRYCHPSERWHVWTGQRWQQDDTAEIRRRAKAMVRSIYTEAASAGDEVQRKALGEHARKSESESRIKAAIELAKSEPGVPVLPDQLDVDPWLLNATNGTVDLRSGKLRPHCREDLITKLAPVAYIPDATLTQWDDFLADTTNADADLIGFLQRAVGYSLTGDCREEVLFFVHGPAAAGKSTFIEVIKAALGDYTRTADFESFLQRRDVVATRNDIARLAGARFVASIEVDEGKRLAEGLIKNLTGNDTVAARFLYHESFEFLPTFKLWLCANHAPKINDDDEATWRRILRVPFEQVVPKDRRDPKVKAALKDPDKAGPAVLAWAIKGCLEWQAVGLSVPGIIRTATDAYRDNMDPLRDFLADCCILQRDTLAVSSKVYKSYENWAESNGEKRPLGRKRFSDRLVARGCESVREYVNNKQLRCWKGIKLQEQQDA